MPTLPTASVDMILCDLPYGTTQCKWDTVIPFDALWENYRRVAKPTAAIVLFGSQPFSSRLVASRLDLFRYEIVWEKEQLTNFLSVRKQIGKIHELLLVFYKNQCVYNPQKTISTKPSLGGSAKKAGLTETFNSFGVRRDFGGFERYPTSIIKFNRQKKPTHPTQKPVPLLEYLIKTYTHPGMVVLDNCMGSGSTGVACINTGRHFIGIEKDQTYFQVAKERIDALHQ